MFKMKYVLNQIKNRLDIGKESISKFEDIVIEIF